MYFRRSERKRVSLTVFLGLAGQGWRRCKASNLSRGGMLVDSGSAPLPRGVLLDVVFVLDRGRLVRLHRARALVVHDSSGGTGLKFYSTAHAWRRPVPAHRRSPTFGREEWFWGRNESERPW